MGIFAYLKQLLALHPQNVDEIVASLAAIADRLDDYHESKLGEYVDLVRKVDDAKSEITGSTRVKGAIRDIIG